jgi:hypothetical protein
MQGVELIEQAKARFAHSPLVEHGTSLLTEQFPPVQGSFGEHESPLMEQTLRGAPQLSVSGLGHCCWLSQGTPFDEQTF